MTWQDEGNEDKKQNRRGNLSDHPTTFVLYIHYLTPPFFLFDKKSRTPFHKAVRLSMKRWNRNFPSLLCHRFGFILLPEIQLFLIFYVNSGKRSRKQCGTDSKNGWNWQCEAQLRKADSFTKQTYFFIPANTSTPRIIAHLKLIATQRFQVTI